MTDVAQDYLIAEAAKSTAVVIKNLEDSITELEKINTEQVAETAPDLLTKLHEWMQKMESNSSQLLLGATLFSIFSKDKTDE